MAAGETDNLSRNEQGNLDGILTPLVMNLQPFELKTFLPSLPAPPVPGSLLLYLASSLFLPLTTNVTLSGSHPRLDEKLLGLLC